MHQIIQFNQIPERKHHIPANEVSKQQTTPKHPTTLKYAPRNQPTTYNQQNATQTSLCYLKQKQLRQKRNYKKEKQNAVHPEKKYNFKPTIRNKHTQHSIAKPGLLRNKCNSARHHQPTNTAKNTHSLYSGNPYTAKSHIRKI